MMTAEQIQDYQEHYRRNLKEIELSLVKKEEKKEEKTEK